MGISSSIVLFLVAGTFIDVSPGVILFGPILLPTIRQVGADPIQFTVIMVFALAIGGGSVMDPALTLTLPANITAETGMDAFTHAIECYTSNKSNYLSDIFALRPIELISQNIHLEASAILLTACQTQFFCSWYQQISIYIKYSPTIYFHR